MVSIGASFVPDIKDGIVAKAIHLKTMNYLTRFDDEITDKELSLSKIRLPVFKKSISTGYQRL
jgi:hypothetical protein